jgi:ubiquinone/menaquinone biosynthesis C-methylase UbiE
MKPFFFLAQKIWWKIRSLKVKIFGTSYLKQIWRKKKISDFLDISHPHRNFLIKKISKFYPFSNVLEIGCGFGPNLYLLAKKFPKVNLVGIDINNGAIEKGKKLFEKEKIKNVKLFVKEAKDLNFFKEKSFDIVFTDAVLMYLGPDEIERVIREMIKIAKKALILVEWHIPNLKKDVFDPHIGVWKRDYFNLLKEYFPKERILLEKIPKNSWPDENWQKYGWVIEAKIEN